MKTTYQTLFDRQWNNLFEKLTPENQEAIKSAPTGALAAKLSVDCAKYAEEMEEHLADEQMDRDIEDSK